MLSALGASKNLEPYSSEPSKRHTMSYEPETLPAMEHIDQRPSPIKKQKEKVLLTTLPLVVGKAKNGKIHFLVEIREHRIYGPVLSGYANISKCQNTNWLTFEIISSVIFTFTNHSFRFINHSKTSSMDFCRRCRKSL